MEEKERYSYDYFIDGAVFIDTENDRDMDMDTVCSLLNQQNERIKELQEENQQLKDQVKKSYQEGLLQKQFDKDMEIQELKDKIEFLTTFKEVISEHKPAFCKLAGRDCEWLGKEKQLAINEKTILKSLDKKWKWLARDKDGILYVYTHRPIRSDEDYTLSDGSWEKFNTFGHLFQSIQWTDDEPVEIEKVIRE